MESSTILTADILDIIFEGRNKEYGAYDLRRNYRKRLAVAITVMLSMICMLFIGFAFAGKKELTDLTFLTKDVTLTSVTPPAKPAELLPPPRLKTPPPPMQVQTLKVTPPKIVPDEQVTKDEMPPVETQEDVKIGLENKDGVKEGDMVIAPPGDGDGKVIELPEKDDDGMDGIFTSVQIESEYPGGAMAWQRFLNKNVRYPEQAVEQEIQGPVVVQFIVDKEGNVSDVVALSGPDELRAEAVRVIKKSGKWTPAIQNGTKVKSYKKQPIVFRLTNE